jgi:hypothetical protein
MRHVASLRDKAAKNIVRVVDDGLFKVVSATSGNEYTVRRLPDGAYACDCRYGDPYQTGRALGKSGCSHSLAVALFVAAEEGKRLAVHDGEDAAKRQHRPRVDLGNGLVVTFRGA